ncbi:MAG: 2-oxoacid:ferredoxin oxidoreductase subunit beta [Phycisphaerae bacterium]|nr:2-oxoacid:ferredoxin oxidoreductase subunit beta [Phycisphaerae bacterium]
MTAASAKSSGLTAKDFKTDQQVKWCPGCGDHSALIQLQKVLASLGVKKENTVCVSGIGCSSRFPYYLDTYGFHGIHGRALPIATGVKCANPDLDVWVITGDGDALSIGGNHFLHAIRRNVGLKVILLNNRIYGLTKGQYSPTSEFGTRTKSSPMGAIDHPIHPISVAIGSEITFVARSVDNDVQHLQYVLRRAAAHKGTAFVEIYQNCQVYNAGAFSYLTDRQTKSEHVVYLEHAKPLIFGKKRDKGIRLRGELPEVVELNKVSEDELVIHDEKTADPSMAFRLARMHHPEHPVPLGVFLACEKATYEDLLMGQIETAREKKGIGRLEQLFRAGDIWEVQAEPAPDEEPIETSAS